MTDDWPLTEVGVRLATTVAALVASVALVLTKQRHGHLSLDSTLGVQKAHLEPTPRVGGIAVFFGLFLAWALGRPPESKAILVTLLVAGMPALAVGLAEDLTKRVTVSVRLIGTLASGLLAWQITGQTLHRVDVPLVDILLSYPAVAIAFTAFTVAGVANAINMVDGFHGLASGISMIALVALGVLAASAGDTPVAGACWTMAAAVAGFWLVNYPFGKLFLGDGGAYFTGFALAWLCILVPMRNPGVSPWASLLLCSYPITEALYSIMRRWRLRQSPGHADDRHLHSLIQTRLVRRWWPTGGSGMQNAAVAPLIWLSVLPSTLLALRCPDQTGILLAGAIGCMVAYHLAYRGLMRMRESNGPLSRNLTGLKEQALADGERTASDESGR